MRIGAAHIIQGDALALPLPNASVDLICTSPPYFGLRSYQDNGQHYDGQIGSEATPAEFLDALLAATREMVRVLKPSGSIFVNLGDRYMGKAPGPQGQNGQRADRVSANEPAKAKRAERERRTRVEQFTREDAAWLAGVIDSDGSISIKVNTPEAGLAPSFVPWVRVGQMRPEVVQRIAEIVGTGTAFQDARGVWNWAAAAQQARWILERIHPWLLIKKRQAWGAIEIARHIEERNAKGSWRVLTADDIAYRQRIRDAVVAWNKGRPDDMPLPEPPAVPLPIYPLAPRDKSLIDIPHAYAQECIGRLGLILRAEIIWNKPNGLPESVTDRVRRSHEQWFHFVRNPRYFAAVDEIREETQTRNGAMTWAERRAAGEPTRRGEQGANDATINGMTPNALGKLPGSVWTIPTQPLTVPPELGIDHFAAYPMEWPRRIIQGWTPNGVCTACGQGRRPIVAKSRTYTQRTYTGSRTAEGVGAITNPGGADWLPGRDEVSVTGYTCACAPQGDFDCCAPLPPTTPAVVVDPFGGTGTTALVAKALGRTGISIDLSSDYCRLAEWRCNDPRELAAALQVEKPEPVPVSQPDLFA